MKLLGKKLSKANKPSESCDARISESPCKSDERTFHIYAVLDEKCFNKELGRWLFINPEDGEIVVTESPNVEFIATGSLYRYTDNMYRGPFEIITVKRVLNEKV
jgi:hypothetical protein